MDMKASSYSSASERVRTGGFCFFFLKEDEVVWGVGELLSLR